MAAASVSEPASISEYSQLDATAMAALVRDKQITAAELRNAATQQHLATHADINAIVEWYEDPDESTAVASLADPSTLPLAGVPFLRKDYGSAEAGRLLEMGSSLAQGYRSPVTSEYYRRLKAAGAQVLGRTAVPELIQHGSTETRVFGATHNPHDLSLSAGGSSGGSGAAIAAGVVPAAHASDCAGSIRIPAAVCGLVGLKPSRRFVGWENGGWGGIAEEFVLTRTIRDARLFCSVLGDAISSNPASSSASRSSVGSGGAASGGAPRRIAVSLDHWSGATADETVVAETRRAAALFESMGHQVEEIPQPIDNERLMGTWHALFSRWVANDVAWLEAATGRTAGAANLEPLTCILLDEIATLSVADITRAQETMGSITFDYLAALAGYDVLLTPTLGRPTIPLGTLAGEVSSMDDYLRRNDETFPYSYLANVTGAPALSVPVPSPLDAQHPLGVQLMGRWGDDHLLLDLAAELT